MRKRADIKHRAGDLPSLIREQKGNRIGETDADNTPVFQLLEFARLQEDSTWTGELVKQYFLDL